MKKFNAIKLPTDRLLLRPIELHDLNEVYAMFSDNQTMQYWDDVPLQNMLQAKEKINRNRQANAAGSALTLAVELKASQGMIGQISLFNMHQVSARAEVGYVLSSEHWQKGLMHEAMQAFIAFCFTGLKLRRLEADIDPANMASTALLQKLGFAQEGLLKQRWQVGGLITDSALFGLLKSTWQNSKA